MKIKTVPLPDKKQPHSNHRRAEETPLLQQEIRQISLIPNKEQEEVSWTWKRQSFQGRYMQIKLCYRKIVFEDIRSVLTAAGGKKILQQFCDGCFGNLMHFIGGTSCSKALHELMSRGINFPDAREDELWFHISGTNIRFAPAEYALVTGLRFGSSSFDPPGSHDMPPDGVYKRFCGGKPITVKELWKLFNLRAVRGTAEDYLKVAQILALYLMVLGYDHRKTVEHWVWVLVENLGLWNKYPWGAYTYRALMHYVSILPRTSVGLGSGYNFYGSVWALQIWAYEAIPDLGNTCAFVTGEATIPRCLKWSFPNRHVELAHFFEQKLVCSVTLEPTDEEQLQPYWVSVRTPEPLGVRYAPPRRLVATGGRAKAPLASDETSSVHVSLQQPHCSSKGTRTVESSAEPVHPDVSDTDGSVRSTPTPSARPRHRQEGARASMHSDIFDEARFVDRVSSRVVDRLIEPVAQRLIEPMVERVAQRLIEPVVERLTLALHHPRHSPSQLSPPQPPPSREVHDQVKTTPTKKQEKKKSDMSKHTRRSPSSSDDEGCESSYSGNERRRKMKMRCKKKKRKYSESSLPGSTDSDRI